MTDTEIITEQQKAIKSLQRKINQLAERLRAKMKFEESFLLGTGADMRFVAKIQRKDQKALEGV